MKTTHIEFRPGNRIYQIPLIEVTLVAEEDSKFTTVYSRELKPFVVEETVSSINARIDRYDGVYRVVTNFVSDPQPEATND